MGAKERGGLRRTDGQPARIPGADRGSTVHWPVRRTMDGDLNALLQVLAPDVNVWADSGGKARAAGPHPVHGRDKVAP